jgi:hypothetical protein
MLAPAGTAAVLITAPTPVITEQPMRAALSSGISGRIGMAHDSWTTAREAYVPTWPYWWTGRPRSERRVVPSRRTPRPGSRRSQRFGRPMTQ